MPVGQTRRRSYDPLLAASTQLSLAAAQQQALIDVLYPCGFACDSLGTSGSGTDGNRSSSSSSGSETTTTIAVAVTVSVVIIGLLALLLFFYFRRQHKRMVRREQHQWLVKMDDLEGTDVPSRSIHRGFFKPAQQMAYLQRITLPSADAARPRRSVVSKHVPELDYARLKQLRHPNIVEFFGVVVEPEPCAIYEFMSKGSLEDVLGGEGLPGDEVFKIMLAVDIARGLEFLHANGIAHQQLRPSKVLVNNHFVCKLTGFAFRPNECVWEVPVVRLERLWFAAPEVITMLLKHGVTHEALDWFKADVFAYGIIFWCLYTGEPLPYGELALDAETLYDTLVARHTHPRFPPPEEQQATDQYGHTVQTIMTRCWESSVASRPTVSEISVTLQRMLPDNQGVLERMSFMLDKYTTHLEEIVKERTEELSVEKKRVETVLDNLLPRPIADRLKREQCDFIADEVPSCTVFFSDIVGFTRMSHQATPADVVKMLNALFTRVRMARMRRWRWAALGLHARMRMLLSRRPHRWLTERRLFGCAAYACRYRTAAMVSGIRGCFRAQMDMLLDRFGLEKIKTIGDACTRHLHARRRAAPRVAAHPPVWPTQTWLCAGCRRAVAITQSARRASHWRCGVFEWRPLMAASCGCALASIRGR